MALTLNILFKPSYKKLIENELDESSRLLLQAHTNKEYWEAQVGYYETQGKRLAETLNTMEKD